MQTRNVLITGSTSGIGLITANTLKCSNYRVFKTGSRNLDEENYFSCDLSSPDNVLALYNRTKERFGDIDVLINNAGCYLYKPVEDITKDEIIRIFNINFLSHFYLTSLIISDMKKNKFGRIVNISSISANVGEAYASLYSSSKAAFYGFTKSLALELAQFNITVNSISPGWVETPLSDILDEDEKREVIDVTPQKRFIEPIEIANLIKYLISDEAKGITGQNINLCAGLSVGC